MASEWPIRELADLCDSVDYGYTASAKEMPCGPKFLRITDIVSGSISWDSVPFCEIEDAARSRFLLHHNDVVIARTGATTGYSAHIANPPDAVFASYLVRLKIGPEADSRFIAYFLKSHRFWGYMRGVLGDKSAQPNASAKTMTQVMLHRPPLKEQQAVACILGALDDKIELNRRMNRTLEGMAQSIFKSWFVDFDPVRAKAAGQQPPGLKPDLAALFPDAFEGSELGEIPKGWKLGRLDDLLLFQRGFDLPKHKRIDGPFPVISAGSPSGFHCEKRVSGPGVVTGRSGKLGNVYYVHDDFWPLNTTLWVKEFRVSSPIHAYHHLRLLDLSIFNAGSAVPTLNRNHVHNLPTVVPNVNVVQAFSHIVIPMYELIKSNKMQSALLVGVRNTLLPKLISGELRVPDAERIVGRQP